MGKHSQYGVILDAGSSGTRIYIYKWKHPIAAVKNASPAELRKLPKVKLKKSKKIHTGIATFADDVASVGRDHLQPLIDTALDEVPSDKIKATPIYLMATAGVRFLPKPQQLSLLQGVCAYLKANTKFYLPDCKERVQVISGETEGLYGWIATNYLLGGLDRPEEHNHGKDHHTYGFLEMGGASAQIAFAPNVTEAERHANDLKLIRLRHLDGSSSEFKIFCATWLGFGANKARSRYVHALVESYGDTVEEIPDPCIPKGLRISTTQEVLADKTSSNGYNLVGTGAFDECLRKTFPLLGKDKSCEDHPCLLNGQHVPAIDFEVNHFVGVSEFWHTTHGVFGKEKKAYDLATFQQKVMSFCGRDWETIQSEILKRRKSPEQRIQDARDACFKASWLINLLYEGIGIPRLGLKAIAPSSLNSTHGSNQGSTKEEFLDPFQPIDTVQGVEVSWTLGKMVLYAAGQIPPGPSTLPVGFGSNVAAKMTPDFEHAGSLPLSAGSFETPDSDADENASPGAQVMFNIFGLVVVFMLFAYIFRKPDRRRRICSKFTRWRRQSGRKTRRRGNFFSKLFGRGSANYERVLEEAVAAEFELNATSDNLDCSDNSEGSCGNNPAGTTPKITLERLDQIHPPSVMDRAGLVIRTESRERLSTNLQMLNAGRKSRAGSPTRFKSPFMAPSQDA